MVGLPLAGSALARLALALLALARLALVRLAKHSGANQKINIVFKNSAVYKAYAELQAGLGRLIPWRGARWEQGAQPSKGRPMRPPLRKYHGGAERTKTT